MAMIISRNLKEEQKILAMAKSAQVTWSRVSDQISWRWSRSRSR